MHTGHLHKRATRNLSEPGGGGGVGVCARVGGREGKEVTATFRPNLLLLFFLSKKKRSSDSENDYRSLQCSPTCSCGCAACVSRCPSNAIDTFSM